MASLDPPVAKAGVYAVREAPVSARNLLAAFAGAPLTPYVPQSYFLSLISLGSRRAVASWGRINAEGPLIWRLKDHIRPQVHAAIREVASRLAVDRSPVVRGFRRHMSHPINFCAFSRRRCGSAALAAA